MKFLILQFLLISVVVINLTESRHLVKRKSLYICHTNLSFGAKIHVFLMKLMGKHEVFGKNHIPGCTLVNTVDKSSGEDSDSDEVSVTPKNLVINRKNEPKWPFGSDSKSSEK